MVNRNFLLSLATILTCLTCERDDICPEDTPTTPQLVLRFYDLADPDETQSVPDLFAYGLDDGDVPFELLGVTVATTDSLAIPLNTNTDQTRFVLHQNYEIDDNGTPDDPSDDMVLGNPDIITVNYVKEDVYVSRACGFKTVFNDISFSVELDGDNWIINSEIVNNIVDNQNAAHVKVYH